MEVLEIFLSSDFYSAAFRLTAPLMFAVAGGVISERAGVLNMALEGMMLTGAFFAYLGSVLFNNVYMGVLFAALASMLVASLHAFMCIQVKVNQVVSAVGINTLAVGLTSTLFRFMFGISSQMTMCPGFSPINIPGLSEIPFIGPVFFGQNPLTYLAVVAVIGVNYFLYHTSRGLELRAAGENPRAVDVAGVDVIGIRWRAVIATGFFCGLAGACLTITGLNTFYDNITSGRGFIAYAAIVFGKWNPIGAALAAFLFGAGDALQLRMQSLSFDIPYYFYQMLPYLITFLSLVLFMGPAKGPAANGSAFEKDKARKHASTRRIGGK